jgi:hypothetical protein
MTKSLLRPKVFTDFFSVRFKPETVEKLRQEAHSKGYASPDEKQNKQPRSGVTRLIREIIEEHYK